MNISPSLSNRLKETISRCAPMDSDQVLIALFSDNRISAWRDRVKKADTIAERKSFLMDLLLQDERNAQKEPLIISFLTVLRDNIDPGNMCHKEIDELIQDIEKHLPYQTDATLMASTAPYIASLTWEEQESTGDKCYECWLSGNNIHPIKGSISTKAELYEDMEKAYLQALNILKDTHQNYLAVARLHRKIAKVTRQNTELTEPIDILGELEKAEQALGRVLPENADVRQLIELERVNIQLEKAFCTESQEQIETIIQKCLAQDAREFSFIIGQAYNMLGVILFDKPESTSDDLRKAYHYWQEAKRCLKGINNPPIGETEFKQIQAQPIGNLAIFAYNRGEFSAAIQQYEELEKLLPPNRQLQNNLALAYMELGEVEEALEIAERTLLNPNGNVPVLVNNITEDDQISTFEVLLKIYVEKLKRTGKSSTENTLLFQKIEELYYKYLGILKSIECKMPSVNQEESSEAQKKLYDALRELHRLMIETYLDQCKFDEAIEQKEKVTWDIGNDDPDWIVTLARLSRHKGDLEKARAGLDQALREFQKRDQLHKIVPINIERIDILIKLHKDDEARKILAELEKQIKELQGRNDWPHIYTEPEKPRLGIIKEKLE